MMDAMSITALAYRRAIRRHHFEEPYGRLVAVVIELSYEFDAGARYEAWFPTQRALALMARIPESSASKGIRRLLAQRVLSRRRAEKGFWLALNPPAGWSVPERAYDISGELMASLERWLGQCVGETPWLIAPPPLLAEALRETFAESAGALIGETEKGSRERPGANKGDSVDARNLRGEAAERPQEKCQVPECGEGAERPQVSPELSFQREKLAQSEDPELAPSEVSAGAIYTRARVGTDRIDLKGIGSVQRNDQPNDRIDPIDREKFVQSEVPPRNREYRDDVEHRLFTMIGWQERTGRSAHRFQEGLDLFPRELEVLISECQHLQKTGELRGTPGQFINGCLGKLFDKMKEQRRK
jgi:hypothetical protein